MLFNFRINLHEGVAFPDKFLMGPSGEVSFPQGLQYLLSPPHPYHLSTCQPHQSSMGMPLCQPPLKLTSLCPSLWQIKMPGHNSPGSSPPAEWPSSFICHVTTQACGPLPAARVSCPQGCRHHHHHHSISFPHVASQSFFLHTNPGLGICFWKELKLIKQDWKLKINLFILKA